MQARHLLRVFTSSKLILNFVTGRSGPNLHSAYAALPQGYRPYSNINVMLC